MKVRLLAPFSEIKVDGKYYESPYAAGDIVDVTRIDALCYDLGCEEVVASFDCPVLGKIEGTVYFDKLESQEDLEDLHVLVYFQNRPLRQ